MKVHQFETLVSKLDLRTRNARDRLAWFEHEGQVVTRTRRSHGNKELPGHLIRQQLKVNEKQFSGLISCELSRKDYVAILFAKGIITAKPEKT